MTLSLHHNGFLGYVQGTGKDPSAGQPVGYDTVPNFEDFGLGAFLLAGSELYKLTLTAEPVADVNVALTKMRQTNRYFMDKWPDPGVNIVTNRSRASNIWTRATYYEGLMALYGIDANQDYYDYAVAWGRESRLGPAGRQHLYTQCRQPVLRPDLYRSLSHRPPTPTHRQHQGLH